MANWWEAIKVVLHEADLHCAQNWALGVAEKGQRVFIENHLASSYWTPYQADLYGHIGEHIFSRFSGLPLKCDPAVWRRRGPDAGDWQVKSIPWKKLEHFHLSHGGRIPVPGYTRSPVVAVSYFLENPMRGYVDGWIPWEKALGFSEGGRVRGASGRRARMIPYAALLSAQSIPG